MDRNRTPLTVFATGKALRAMYLTSLGIGAQRMFRRLDDKVLPSVRIDWEAHYLLGELFREAFNAQWSPLNQKMNKIVQRYLAERSKNRALKMLAREAAKMGAELMEE